MPVKFIVILSAICFKDMNMMGQSQNAYIIRRKVYEIFENKTETRYENEEKNLRQNDLKQRRVL